jgi:hypothetical protein
MNNEREATPAEERDTNRNQLDDGPRGVKTGNVSESLGMPVLLDDPAPLSSLLHIPTLITEEERPSPVKQEERGDDPAPLSEALHIPTLIKEEDGSPEEEDGTAPAEDRPLRPR